MPRALTTVEAMRFPATPSADKQRDAAHVRRVVSTLKNFTVTSALNTARRGDVSLFEKGNVPVFASERFHPTHRSNGKLKQKRTRPHCAVGIEVAVLWG